MVVNVYEFHERRGVSGLVEHLVVFRKICTLWVLFVYYKSNQPTVWQIYKYIHIDILLPISCVDVIWLL